MIRRQWIKDNCNGLTFCDIGGLWGTVNQNFSDAINAKSRTLLDKYPKSDPLWGQMKDYIKGFVDYEEVSCNVNEIDRTWDMVNCAGVLYHYPKPDDLIKILTRITNKTLILTTVFTKNIVENKFGKVQTDDFFYLPKITEYERNVLQEDWRVFLKNLYAPGLTYYLDDWQTNAYDLWWWLFTEDYLDQLFSSYNLKIIDKCIEDKTISYMLKVDKTFL